MASKKMPEIINLGMYDEEYLKLLEQGRDPVNEYFYKKQLIRSGFSSEDAQHIVLLLMNQQLSAGEEAVIREFWRLVMG